MFCFPFALWMAVFLPVLNSVCVSAHHRSQLSHCVCGEMENLTVQSYKGAWPQGIFLVRSEPGYLELGKMNPFLWCSESSITAADIMHQCNAVIFHSFTPNPFFILAGLE